MKTVADLSSVDFPLLWHEAVAVVQEVASQVSPDRGISADKDLIFNEDGTITVDGASQDRGDRVPVVTALGRLLQRLLPDDAPDALRAFALENSGEQPSHPTLDAFTGALAFFERPGRAGHLLAVAARLQDFTPRQSPEQELERLRKKVTEGPDEPPVTAPVTRRSIHPGYAAGGALAIVALIASTRLPVSGLLTSLSNNLLPAAAGSATAAAPTAADPGENSAPPTDAATAETGSLRSHQAAADRRRPVASRRTASSGGSAGSLQAVVTSPAEVNDRSSVEAAQAQPSAALAAPARDTTPLVDLAPHLDLARTYSGEDTVVAPAVFVRPQLPSEPQPGPTTGYFDLTVDERGSVANVRLISPVGRIQERLLVSAAKAWRFRPALLDGHPVKYRMRVAITLPEQH